MVRPASLPACAAPLGPVVVSRLDQRGDCLAPSVCLRGALGLPVLPCCMAPAALSLSVETPLSPQAAQVRCGPAASSWCTLATSAASPAAAWAASRPILSRLTLRSPDLYQRSLNCALFLSCSRRQSPTPMG
ncbi:hypothetical protein NDU88_005246 [Pleurodeles waltl]|uniref:Uncharacterized protein n=1 Tax=Pleurodeles waltl TaxID=8319 RepID=A0AAV7WCT4_PLEWA|nr:hypothetical protein NDU88_005246 [Pleurodeles waltl]